MEPYIYYGKLPLIEEGPVADYKGYGKETTVTISIRFRAATWRNDVKAMGFLLDAPFPAIGYYTPIPEVVVSSITPSSPDGPTILIQISGAGTFGGSTNRSDTDFANNLIYTPFENPYRLTLPLQFRRRYIISDRTALMPYEENFTAKDAEGKEYTATGRKSSRYILIQGGDSAAPDTYTGGYSTANWLNNRILNDRLNQANKVWYEPDGKTFEYDDFLGVIGGFIRESLRITEWTSVRNKAYTTP